MRCDTCIPPPFTLFLVTYYFCVRLLLLLFIDTFLFYDPPRDRFFRMHKRPFWKLIRKKRCCARRSVLPRRQRISPMAGRLISFQRNKATEGGRTRRCRRETGPVRYKRHRGSFARERARVQPPVSLLVTKTSLSIRIPAWIHSRFPNVAKGITKSPPSSRQGLRETAQLRKKCMEESGFWKVDKILESTCWCFMLLSEP